MENSVVVPEDLSGRLGKKQSLYNILILDYNPLCTNLNIEDLICPIFKMSHFLSQRYIFKEKVSKFTLIHYLYNHVGNWK